ncbi:hypothetical protein BJ085DRAFT_25021, partial [Dimargaris cristalligena]
YTSARLDLAQQNYSVTKCKCLVILFALKKFHLYLYGQYFTIKMDVMMGYK